MENEAQIKQYIEDKNKDSPSGALDTIKSEFNSLIGREEKETWDWLKLFEWLKNDNNLLKYAELKSREKDLKRWEKVKMELLELKLSITCPYFKDFKQFLEELSRWENISQSWENWSETVEYQGKTFCGLSVSSVSSSPYYRNSQTWVTWCSKTARENGKRFGLVLPSWNAYDAWERQWQDCKWTLPPDKVNDRPRKNWNAISSSDFISWAKWNYADIYVESWSDYGHRAAAFRDDSGQRYVLDPYTRVNWRLDTSPKKLEDYMSCKKTVKAHFYESKWYVWECAEAPNGSVESAVQWALWIAEDNCYWYEWWGRGKNNEWKWWYDCASLVCTAFKNAWFDVPVTWCGPMQENFEKVWFEWISPYDPNNLQRGDILLDKDKHTELYIWNWRTVWAHWDKDWRDWDSWGDEISETDGSYFLHKYHQEFWWDWVLRYKWN